MSKMVEIYISTIFIMFWTVFFAVLAAMFAYPIVGMFFDVASSTRVDKNEEKEREQEQNEKIKEQQKKLEDAGEFDEVVKYKRAINTTNFDEKAYDKKCRIVMRIGLAIPLVFLVGGLLILLWGWISTLK